MGQSICQTVYSKIFRMLNFINKKMKTAVVVAIAANINNEKVVTTLKLRHLLICAKKTSLSFNKLDPMKYGIK